MLYARPNKHSFIQSISMYSSIHPLPMCQPAHYTHCSHTEALASWEPHSPVVGSVSTPHSASQGELPPDTLDSGALLLALLLALVLALLEMLVVAAAAVGTGAHEDGAVEPDDRINESNRLWPDAFNVALSVARSSSLQCTSSSAHVTPMVSSVAVRSSSFTPVISIQ